MGRVMLVGWDTVNGDVFGESLNLGGPLKEVASMVWKGMSSAADAAAAPIVQELLLQATQSYSQPPTCVRTECMLDFTGDRFAILAQFVEIVDTALSTLQDPSDIATVAAMSSATYMFESAVHSNPEKTYGQHASPGMMPASLLRFSAHQTVASIMHITAMEQLQGNRPLGDWAPAIAALKPLREQMPGTDSRADAAAEMVMLQLASQSNPILSSKQLKEFRQETEAAVTYGQLPGLAALAVLQEAARAMPLQQGDEAFTKRMLTCDAFQRNGVLMLRIYLCMLQSQILQLVDDTFNCWSFSFYWLDIVGLALQEAGGKPGPAAVAAAQQLMKEKHSIFVARLVLRFADALAPSFPVRSKSMDLISTTPLLMCNDFRQMIATRGDVKATAYLAAHQKAANSSSSFPPTIDARARSACAADNSSGRSSSSSSSSNSSSSSSSTLAGMQQQLDKILMCATSRDGTAQQLQKLFASAGVQAGSGQQLQPVDPALADALQMWWGQLSEWRITSSTNMLPVGGTTPWLPVALAHLHVLRSASSPAAARLLMGENAVPQQYLWAVGDYMSSRSVPGELLAQRICSLGWSLSSTAAAAIDHSNILLLVPLGPLQLRSSVWLVAAAASPPSQKACALASLRISIGTAHLRLAAQRLQQPDDEAWQLLDICNACA
ncbi:hypothetical protein OEZ86_004821 [Tetradesmus obliquus]|nr:hypothetical protein OEZ86_004821 [Tetradesmus obliquus]